MGHTQESSEAICVEQEESLSEEAAKEAVEERKMPDRRVLRKKSSMEFLRRSGNTGTSPRTNTLRRRSGT